MALITLKNLRLAYGSEPLLDDVELTIEAGERLCLVGRNGSGKSTLMQVLDGRIVDIQKFKPHYAAAKPWIALLQGLARYRNP